jgi:integrase
VTEQSELLAQVRRTICNRCLSKKTENAYLNHIRGFCLFHEDCDLSVDGAEKISAFLEYLDSNKHHAVATRNQARCAVFFLYKEVFGQKLSKRFDKIKPVHLTAKPQVVFTHEEAKAVLANLRKRSFLVAALMYGAGLRLSEAVALRVGDIDFERREIVVRDVHTGRKDRTTLLPIAIISALEKHLVPVRYLYEDDCLGEFGELSPPKANIHKNPDDDFEWNRQFVFPSHIQQPTDTEPRHHLAESTVQKSVAEALRKANIVNHAACQTFRRSFAVRLFENNHDVHTIRKLLGHRNLKTTMIYLQFAGHTFKNVRSPLDFEIKR